MIFWRIAYRNVKKNWRHSLSALLSLSASFVSLVLFDGYIDDLKLMYEDSFRHRSMLGDLIIERPEIHSKAGLAAPLNDSVAHEWMPTGIVIPAPLAFVEFIERREARVRVGQFLGSCFFEVATSHESPVEEVARWRYAPRERTQALSQKLGVHTP